MKYSELIEKYVNAELDPEQAEKVGKDIERHEAISDYLAGREDIPELSGLADEPAAGETPSLDESKAFAKKVKKQIRRAFLKAGLITGALILAIVFFCMYALPKIIDRSYYDPTETAGYIKDDDGNVLTQSPTNRLSLDISVYSELFLPGRLRQLASANSLGYGNYNVCIYQNFSNTGVFRDTAGMIQKGSLTLYDPNILKLPVMNCFDTVRAGLHGVDVSFEGMENSLETLTSGMQENDRRMTYVTFDAPMSYTDVITWCGENGIAPEWGAVCTGGEIKPRIFYGAKFALNSVMQGFDEERYPHLSLFSLAQETHPDTDYASEELMREHIASLLSYCADNREGMKLFYSAGDIDELLDGCRASADYIRENGFSVYGIAFIGDKEQIENVYGLDNVAYMYSEGLD